MNDYNRFANLSFGDFRKMAKDDSLSCYEKIGFPNSYRQGKEHFIFEDIISKLPLLYTQNKVVLDIGPGCSELPLMLIDLCRKNEHTLILIDSDEMLSHLPNEPFIKKIIGYYPDCNDLFNKYRGKVDVILTYSVLHYIFVESNIWNFLDSSLELMSDGGEMLIGDIPNISKRKRFFSSQNGIKFHQNFTGKEELPEVSFNKIEHHLIDDSVILALVTRARNQGFDTYILPQKSDLPMANRREDILIRKP
ncbi:methyltransferase type 12 [Nostoc sp. KVJ20]|uniref:methyltransferase type 12 n=1 Tax=unclassified Nostoc TaxID=2593658 RepID=UPI00083CE487|nr:methyltransferase type 12 [Nostoc sp. KVJ20]ODG99003.1 methyltransferase type 12 [Nostoc sp. KVJ20]